MGLAITGSYDKLLAGQGNKAKTETRERLGSMSKDRKSQILIAGLKAGGKDGFSLKQQLGSLAEILRASKVDKALAENVLEEAEASGILNASATLQFLKKQGVIAEKVDQQMVDMFSAALK